MMEGAGRQETGGQTGLLQPPTPQNTLGGAVTEDMKRPFRLLELPASRSKNGNHMAANSLKLRHRASRHSKGTEREAANPRHGITSEDHGRNRKGSKKGRGKSNAIVSLTEGSKPSQAIVESTRGHTTIIAQRDAGRMRELQKC